MFFAYANRTVVSAGQSRETVKIKTSAQCETCKANIEKALSFTKGVKGANLDVDTKVVTVEYDPSKTTVEKIRLAISKAGYDADDVKADPKAYAKLKECCKKPEDKK